MRFFIFKNNMEAPFLTIISDIKINTYRLLSAMNMVQRVKSIFTYSPELLVQTNFLQYLFGTILLKYLVSFTQKSTLQLDIFLYVNVLDGKYQFFEYQLLNRYSQKRQHYRIKLNLLDYLILFLRLVFNYFKLLACRFFIIFCWYLVLFFIVHFLIKPVVYFINYFYGIRDRLWNQRNTFLNILKRIFMIVY